MSSSLWIFVFLLFLHLPLILVGAAASSPPLPRRLLSNESALTNPPSTTSPPVDACSSTLGACRASILPQSRTLTIAVVGIFVACVIMAFISVYARRFCITDGNFRLSYGDMERSGEYTGNEALVKSLPVVKYGAQEVEGKKMMKDCAVCLSEFESGEMLRLLPACDHVFHKDCIDMWLFSHTTCPLCRLSLLKLKKGSISSGTSLPSSVDLQPMLALQNTPPAASTIGV